MNEQTVKITFTLAEVNAILTTLGEVPTKYGVANIMAVLKDRAEKELKPEPKVEEVQEG
jgi:uncharacterized protein YqgV (UPF0045/DUF77 family)